MIQKNDRYSPIDHSLQTERIPLVKYSDLLTAINTASTQLDILRQVALREGNVSGAVGSDTGSRHEPMTAEQVGEEVRKVAHQLLNDVR